jgi:hypothetical protein
MRSIVYGYEQKTFDSLAFCFLLNLERSPWWGSPWYFQWGGKITPYSDGGHRDSDGLIKPALDFQQ